MSEREIRVSDLSDRPDVEGNKMGKLIFRHGPGIEPGKAKVMDVLPDEVAGLADTPDVYLVEYRAHDAGSDDKPVVYVIATSDLRRALKLKSKVRLKALLAGLRYFHGREPKPMPLRRRLAS